MKKQLEKVIDRLTKKYSVDYSKNLSNCSQAELLALSAKFSDNAMQAIKTGDATNAMQFLANSQKYAEIANRPDRMQYRADIKGTDADEIVELTKLVSLHELTTEELANILSAITKELNTIVEKM